MEIMRKDWWNIEEIFDEWNRMSRGEELKKQQRMKRRENNDEDEDADGQKRLNGGEGGEG